jgi:hypothetical protein
MSDKQPAAIADHGGEIPETPETPQEPIEGEPITLANDVLALDLTCFPSEHYTKEDCPICLCQYYSCEECPCKECSCEECRDKCSCEKPHRTQCGHIYHQNCLTTWLQSSETCPMCRATIGLPTEWRCELVLHGETPPRSDFSYDGPEELLTEVIRYHNSIDKDIRNGSFDITWAQYTSDGVRLREVIEKRFEVRRVDKCLVADDHKDGPLEYTIWLKRYE